jgi:hypothetical protein
MGRSVVMEATGRRPDDLPTTDGSSPRGGGVGLEEVREGRGRQQRGWRMAAPTREEGVSAPIYAREEEGTDRERKLAISI